MPHPDIQLSQASAQARIAELEAEVVRLQATATGHADEKTQHRLDLATAQIGYRMAELRQSEAVASEAFVRSLLDANSDCSNVLTPDGRLEMLNTSSLRALEVDDAASLIGRVWAELWPEPAQVLIKAAIQDANAGRPSRFSALRSHKKGTPRWWDVVINPVLDEQGTVTRIFVLSRDVTELHRIQSDAVDANSQLKSQLKQALLDRDAATEAASQGERLQAVGQLVDGVAHDFGNLLQVISGGAALLKKSSLEPARKEKLLDGIITAAEHAQALTSRLLAFSHRDAPKMAAFDVNMRLSSMIELLKRTLASEVAVRTELSEPLCLVEANISQFEIDLLNLAVNARDAMPAGGKLTIHTSLVERADGSFVCIRITDTGQGMPPEVKIRIFEPYYTTKGIGKGTGLGLPQVIDFIKTSAGHIEVESEVGQGSSFSLFLPCKRTSAEGPAA
jgi:PAS domain S-box-containing protein